MREIIIRELTHGDEGAVLALIKENLTKREPAATTAALLEDNSLFAVVLEDGKNKRIVGFATIKFYLQSLVDGYVATIQDVTVDKDYRGTGLGRMLDDRLHEIAEQRLPNKIWLTSSDKRGAAISMYKSSGYEKEDTNFFTKIYIRND